MEEGVQQLVVMGASVAQAKAALRQHKDVMLAAERFLEGKFDHIQDDGGDVEMEEARVSKKKARPPTPDDDDDDDAEMESGGEEDDDVDDYIDYDSDFATKEDTTRNGIPDVDPYAGIFFSKDRREEVIEVEEEPEAIVLSDTKERVTLMSQGQWMKGCPEGSEQSFLFALYSELSEGQCRCPQDCGTTTPRQKSDFFGVFPEFSTYISRLRGLVRRTCVGCKTEFCFACGESTNNDRTNGPAEENILFHCANIQGVILGIGLSMLEQSFAEVTSAMPDAIDEQARKRRKTSGQESEHPVAIMLGTGTKIYAKKSKGGVGYAGDLQEDRSGQLEAQAIQKAKDEKIGKLLSAVRIYLPSLHRSGGGRTSDYLVHPTALAHLRRRFNYVCSTLLRNDSLADMSERSVLYFELMEWLETISNHEALASMMAMPIMVVASVKSVTVRRGLDGRNVRERTIVYEGSSGPRELLEGIVIQAHAALKSLEKTKSPDTPQEELTEEQKRMTLQDMKGKSKDVDGLADEDNQKLISFCRRILSTAKAIDRSLRETKGDPFVDRLHASLPKLPNTYPQPFVQIKIGSTEDDTKKAYIEWATRARFEYGDLTVPTPTIANQDEDSTPHYKFHFDSEARMLANSDIPKRSLAIAKELAILTTNLPVTWDSSIFLRVDETRVDIIKALITGPEGTPYHNGCFLFDIFLGPSYNQSPPNVKYMTTNGGKFRFNPNLYADGKVCLSLLGTWSGPGWVPGKSTLLQVLISIQSMILCEEPYLNEPGWANSGGSPQSQAYSANVRRMVVKTAMLGNLKSPPEPFADVIRTHFRLKAKSIITQLDNWLTMDDGKQTVGDGGFASGRNGEAGTSFSKDVEEMKRLLKELQTSTSNLATL